MIPQGPTRLAQAPIGIQVPICEAHGAGESSTLVSQLAEHGPVWGARGVENVLRMPYRGGLRVEMVNYVLCTLAYTHTDLP